MHDDDNLMFTLGNVDQHLLRMITSYEYALALLGGINAESALIHISCLLNLFQPSIFFI